MERITKVATSSHHADDEAYENYLAHAALNKHVTLDGERVRNCMAADEVAGFVIVGGATPDEVAEAKHNGVKWSYECGGTFFTVEKRGVVRIHIEGVQE